MCTRRGGTRSRYHIRHRCLLFGWRSSRDEGDSCREADADQVRTDCSSGQGPGGSGVDLRLHHLEKTGRYGRGDAIDIGRVGTGLSLEDDVLDAGDVENSQTEVCLCLKRIRKGECNRLHLSILTLR